MPWFCGVECYESGMFIGSTYDCTLFTSSFFTVKLLLPSTDIIGAKCREGQLVDVGIRVDMGFASMCSTLEGHMNDIYNNETRT